MHPDLQTLVEAGSLPAPAARALDALPPGAYCQHKSWGFGQVAGWNPGDNRILVDFGPRKSHPMQLAYAAETLQPLPPDHFLVRKAQDLPGTKRLAAEDPAALVASILTHAPGRRAIATQVLAALVPDVFSEAEVKRWWENAKKALKKDGRFNVPAKKTEFLEMRSASAAPDAAAGGAAEAERLVREFQGARRAKEQLAALDALVKEIEPLRAANTDLAALLGPVFAATGISANQSAQLDTTRALELMIVRDELAAASGLPLPDDAPTLAALLQAKESTLAATLDALPAARQRAAVAALPAAFGEEDNGGWATRVFGLLPQTRHPRVIGEAAKLFETHGRTEDLARFFDRSLRDYSVSCEMLLWLCREHDAPLGKEGPFHPLFEPRLFTAILSALDRDRFGDVKRGTRLRELLLNDRTLGPTLLAGPDAGARRTAARALLATPSMEELDKRSLMARLIRSYPELGALLGGADQDKEADAGTPLIVSWSSLEKRKQEYDKLVNKDIPKNSQEIGLARSYGDLRENFEFKAAKEMQTVLMRRKAELEQALARSRGTNFENPDLSQVSIGTVVTLSDPDGGSAGETYTILGAWDGDPERGVLSYQTVLGQAMLGHRPGEVIELPREAGEPARKLRIETIQPYQRAAAAEAGS